MLHSSSALLRRGIGLRLPSSWAGIRRARASFFKASHSSSLLKHDRFLVRTTAAATMSRALPNVTDLVGYEHAVAGHEGTLSDPSGQLFIKPCTAAEASFYEKSLVDHPDFADFMPTFLGTLQLSDDQESTFEQQGAALISQHSVSASTVAPKLPSAKSIKTNQALVLENAAHGFKHPNILDVKLGVRLWADDAREDKKTRFDKITAKTTHKNLGFRIAGMRVWQGKDAPEGGVVNKEGYRIYDKDYGRSEVNDDNVNDAFRKFFFTESAGIDQQLGLLVIQAFLEDIKSLQEVMESMESRMFSASLLLVFEGDGDALRFAIEEASKPRELSPEQDLEKDEDEDEDDEDNTPKIYSLKVIDFAHAEWLPGAGPDENSLKGVRSVTRILEELETS